MKEIHKFLFVSVAVVAIVTTGAQFRTPPQPAETEEWLTKNDASFMTSTPETFAADTAGMPEPEATSEDWAVDDEDATAEPEGWSPKNDASFMASTPETFAADSTTIPAKPDTSHGSTNSTMNSTTQRTPAFNFTAVPDESRLKGPSERLKGIKPRIVNDTANFYRYDYDGGASYIEDGGGDMYDTGNQVYVWAQGESARKIRYGNYNSTPGLYEYVSCVDWPFTTLMYINNTNWERKSFTIQVKGNTGADSQGRLIYFAGNASLNGVHITYSVSQVYNAGDPTICEVYFAFSNTQPLSSEDVAMHRNSKNTDNIDSGITLSGYPRHSFLAYMLLSKRNGEYIAPYEVSRAVSQFVSAVLDYNETLSFTFRYSPIVVPPTVDVTTTSLPPRNTTHVPSKIPSNSTIRRVFDRINARKRSITNFISSFYYYNYDNDDRINDGGDDMYDGGNMVYIQSNNDNRNKIMITYGNYYSNGVYEFASTTGWPFVALMHINNTNYQHHSFSIQVKSDPGADGSGQLVHYDSDAISNGIRAAYGVTQVYGAGDDPSICEVYFALSDAQFMDIRSRFSIQRSSIGTKELNTAVRLGDYPRRAYLGYMLLSKPNGQMVYQYEVNRAVREVASAIFGYSYTISFYFPTNPTVGPSTTTSAPYQVMANEGFQQKVCGSTKFAFFNTTRCELNESPFIVSLSVKIPTLLGYSSSVQGTISGCLDRDLCHLGCTNITSAITNSSTVLSCESRCCYSSYCNYDFYWSYHHSSSNHTPPNITIPEHALPDIPVEVLPNCVFKTMFPRFKSCLDAVFNAWPFTNPSICKSSLISAVQCGIRELSACRTSDLFTSAMLRLPPNFNLTQVLAPVEQSGVLDIFCLHPTHDIFNATFNIGSPYFPFQVPFFPPHIGVGGPFCDRFILDSVLEWAAESLMVMKTSTERYDLCSSLQGLLQKSLAASENRCNLDMLPSLFPCDSVLRNQIRALIVQAKQLIPNVLPYYCAGIPPPPEPETPDDIPFLPSCTLRQTITSVWSCESIFTKSTPYSDDDVCKTNMNRLLNCAANRLQACGKGDGYNVLDGFSPYLRFEDIVAGIRSLTLPIRYHSFYNFSRFDVRDVPCGFSAIDFSSFNRTLSTLFGICRGNSSDLSQGIEHAYYQYAGARNAMEVCMAFRSLRDWLTETLAHSCDFGLIRYLLPLGHPGRDALSHGVKILLSVVGELEISVCPAPPSTGNRTVTSPTRWLRSYVRWRSHSLPKWQAAYEKWRMAQPEEDITVSPPSCIDLTKISCKNAGMKTCESDYFKCQLCYCSDHKYKGLTNVVLQPWLEDYENWERFQTDWDDDFEKWQNDNEQ